MDFLIDPYRFVPPTPPAFIAYAQLDSSGAPTVPSHQAGDRIVQIMYGQNTLTGSPTPTEPLEPVGWSTIFFEPEEPVFQAVRGMRVAQIVDVDNTVNSVDAGSFPQKAVVVTRYGSLGAFYTTAVRLATDILLPDFSPPSGSLVLWGAQTNQARTYTIPSGLTVLGDSLTPFYLGPTWINGLSAAADYAAASKVLVGSGAAYSRGWAIVLYPGPT
jgi:hypothetical protein